MNQIPLPTQWMDDGDISVHALDFITWQLQRKMADKPSKQKLWL